MPVAAASSPAASSVSISDAIDHLVRFGYCRFDGLIPATEAAALAARCLELHDDPECRAWIRDERPYETLFGMLNLDDRVWALASHPCAVAVARHLLGDEARVAEACSKPAWPGAGFSTGLHVDSGLFPRGVPGIPWLVNSMWMLTDFTEDNGATGVVPMSHWSGRTTPWPGMDATHPLVEPVTGRAGSLLMWHGGTFHTSRPNRTGAARVGLNVAYYPPWFNHYTEAGHQPIWPETFARMPAEMRALCPQRRGRTREEVYERP
jgi:hypothetical protein